MEFGPLQPDSNSFEKEIDLGSDSSSMEGAGNYLHTHDGVIPDLDRVNVQDLPSGKKGMTLNSAKNNRKVQSFITDTHSS